MEQIFQRADSQKWVVSICLNICWLIFRLNDETLNKMRQVDFGQIYFFLFQIFQYDFQMRATLKRHLVFNKTRCPVYFSKLCDLASLCAKNKPGLMWVIPNSPSNGAGNSSSSSSVSLSLPDFEVFAHHIPCWISSNNRTPVLLLKEVATYTHRTHTHSIPSSAECFSVAFWVWFDTLLMIIQRRIDDKEGLTMRCPQKGWGEKKQKKQRNKQPSVAMCIQPPYHFIKMTPDAFFSVWSQSGCCIWLSRAFG